MEAIKTMDSSKDQALEGSSIHHTTTNTDRQRLEQLGISGELKRAYSLPALIGLCLCLMGTWEASSAVLTQALLSGGAPCVFYNYLVTFLCTLAIGASLAEIASAYPTAGGQYHWVTALFPSWGNKCAGWMTGWISLGGQIVLTASPAFISGLMVQGIVVLNDGSYVPTRWQGMLFYWAFVLYAASMNVWGHRLLPTANYISGVLHVVCFIIAFVVLAAKAKKNTAAFVFVDHTNQTGWGSDGVAWMVGLISTIYPFLGYDAACHLAEEIPHAARNVPLAIMGSITLNGLMGLAFCTILLFSIGSLDQILSTPTGFPFIQIFFDVTRSHAGATILSLFPILIAMAAAIAGVTSTSRTLYAFARDRATPFSSFLSKVDQEKRVPIRSIWAIVTLQILLGFIYLASSTAFNAILSMAIISMYASYFMPIFAMLFFGRGGLFKESNYGPFRLGKWLGIILNAISVAWIIVAMLFSTFPSFIPVTPDNMNYSVVVVMGWVLSGVIFYVFTGRHQFEMPIVSAGVIMGIPTGVDIGA